MEELKKLIREVPDFPKPGILFYDITTLLKVPDGFRAVIDGLKERYRGTHIDLVLTRNQISGASAAKRPLSSPSARFGPPDERRTRGVLKPRGTSGPTDKERPQRC